MVFHPPRVPHQMASRIPCLLSYATLSERCSKLIMIGVPTSQFQEFTMLKLIHCTTEIQVIFLGKPLGNKHLDSSCIINSGTGSSILFLQYQQNKLINSYHKGHYAWPQDRIMIINYKLRLPNSQIFF